MGRINEVPAQLRSGRLMLGDADTTAVERIAAGDGAVTLFVRPNEIRLQPDPHARSRIVGIASTGPSVHYEVAVPDLGSAIEVELPREAARALNLRLDDSVQLQILRGRIFGPADPIAAVTLLPMRAANRSA